jgi:hypothetical protein
LPCWVREFYPGSFVAHEAPASCWVEGGASAPRKMTGKPFLAPAARAQRYACGTAPRLCSVEERPFRAVKRNLLETPLPCAAGPGGPRRALAWRGGGLRSHTLVAQPPPAVLGGRTALQGREKKSLGNSASLRPRPSRSVAERSKSFLSPQPALNDRACVGDQMGSHTNRLTPLSSKSPQWTIGSSPPFNGRKTIKKESFLSVVCPRASVPLWHSRPRLCSVEERPFRAVKRNPEKTLPRAAGQRVAEGGARLRRPAQ